MRKVLLSVLSGVSLAILTGLPLLFVSCVDRKQDVPILPKPMVRQQETGIFNEFLVSSAYGQTGSTFGKNYVWQDSLSVNTVGRDSTFTVQWEGVSIWCEDGDAFVKIGAPDVGSLASRKWVRLTEGMVMRFGPETKLVRLQFKGATGAVRFYFLGYKKSKQFN